MRINKLKFSNLNSLKGEFEIDFTDDSITEDNIFAIIGKTGSGKSTILDAITLALFAKTARIEKITGSSNEIMNRDSGSCYSEVIFTTSNKEYSALFSQRKARDKKDGNFVMYKRELRNYSDSRLIASNKTFDAELMDLINLTFDQFSRSVLLAQGDFNKFLIAKDDEKAKILEQITGTEIYSNIGKKIYEHHSFEKNKLVLLDAQLESQNVLTEAEKDIIKDEIKLNSSKIVDINKRKKTNLDNLDFYSRKRSLDKKRIELTSEKNTIEEKKSIYKNYLNKLELNIKAKEPLELLDKINQDTNSKNKLLKTIDIINKELLAIDNTIKQLEDQKATIESASRVNELSKIELSKIIKQVRPIDKNIHEVSINYSNKQNRIIELEKDSTKLSTELSILKPQIIELDSVINKSKEYLTTNISDKLLVDNFSDIVSNNNLFKSTTFQKNTYKDDKKDAELKLINEEQFKKELTIKLNKTIKAIDEIDSNNSSKKNKDELEKELDSLNNRQRILEKTSLTLESYLQDTLDLNKKNKEYEEQVILLNEHKTNLIKASNLYETSKISLERGKELLKLSAFANEVKDNVPCPLCGSINHPHPISLDENQLVNEEKKVNEFENSMNKCNDNVISLNSEMQILGARKAQLESSIEKNSSTLIKALGNVNNFEEAFSKDVSQNNESIINVKSKLKELEIIEKQLIALSTDKTTCNERITYSIKTIFSLENKIKDLEKNISKSNDTLKTIDNFFNEFDSFKCKNNKELDEIKRKYTFNQNTYENTSIEISNLRIQKNKLESDIEIKTNTIQNSKIDLQNIKIELTRLKDNRQAIFGEKDCDNELDSITAKIAENTAKLHSFNDQLNEKDKIKSIKITNKDYHQNNYNILDASLIDDNINFKNLLVKNNFIDKDSLLSAKLDVNTVSTVESFIKSYENLVERIKAIEDDIIKDEKSISINKPEKTYDECIELKDQIDKNYDLLQQNKGNLQEKLDIDKKNIARIGTIKESRDKQYIISDSWAKLNAAVGSSDGKKFRGLAQGITLDFLLNNSNNKLSNLTDRYSLVRSNNSNGSTLDIDVIDLYMNGITRSVNNLSGGEKFLVSLSLALGLCELVNSDNPSETLFLDEGFGTLDEDTLDNALNTLMILSEKENKLIGIISHVQKVKDAINHKIIVERNGDGSSSITGPGVK